MELTYEQEERLKFLLDNYRLLERVIEREQKDDAKEKFATYDVYMMKERIKEQQRISYEREQNDRTQVD